MSIDQRLAELGITLPAARRPGGLLCPGGRSQRPAPYLGPDQLRRGRQPDQRPARRGYGPRRPDIAAARRCGIMLLAQMKAALGSLDRVERVVKLGVFVNSAHGDFTDQPKVANGASRADAGRVRRGRPPCPQRGRRAGAAARRRRRSRCDRRRQAPDPLDPGPSRLRAPRAALRRRHFPRTACSPSPPRSSSARGSNATCG